MVWLFMAKPTIFWDGHMLGWPLSKLEMVFIVRGLVRLWLVPAIGPVGRWSGHGLGRP
jgi:hypothetical protein